MPSRARVRKQGPCLVCASWVCAKCGRKKSGRVKRATRGQTRECRHCKDRNEGHLIDVRHTTNECAG